MNKYYEMFINENVDESIFKINSNSLSFEDHFWHYACMSLYYKKNNDFHMQKKCLSAACDLNYYYNAFIYFDAYGVLPQGFKKYIKKFEHKMKDDKLEQQIAEANKIDKKSMHKGFWLYSLASLLIIPLMLLLVLVFKIDSTLAAIISIVVLFVGQSFINPMMKQRKQMKILKRDSLLTKEERSHFDYLRNFDSVVKNEKYIAMIRVTTDEDRDRVIECIKKNIPLPDDLTKKKSSKSKKNNKKE